MEDTPRRGRLTVYLGAAPGVGKTYAMLGEARRRHDRGTDVVIGYVETHGRAHTEEQLAGLEVLPRRTLGHKGAEFTELDVDAVLARKPAVVCIDELAHTNVPGSPREKRAEDVEVIRAAGIDVITTVNIQHLESLNDEVERITGVRQRETVPDEVVRTADQIQLVDMSPEALRRRMAHGNIYKADNIDASLTSYFRVGNLTALRELALLWLADRVDDALGDYRRAHQIEHTWPTKERIVVAVTGGPESETLIRRGARLAQRAAGSELLAVHVIATDGLRSPDERRIARAQQLVASLDGTFHSVVGEDVSAAVVDFAAGANATMIVVGVSRHGRLRRLFTGTTGDRIASLAGSVDVHLVTHDEVARTARLRPVLSPLSRSRQVAGWVAAVVVPVVLTWALHGFQDTDDLPLAMLGLLAATVLVALVGGLLPALLASVFSFLALNYYFTPPVGKFTISEPRNVLVLLVFVAVAAGVASVVDRASRRAAEALRARAEAATMSALSRSVLTGQDTAEAIVARLRETFGQESVSLLAKAPTGWLVLASSGGHCAQTPDEGDTRVRVDDDHVLALCGEPLRASDQRVLEAFAVQTSLVLEYRRLKLRDERAAALESAEATSTAVLRAVSHDLRTPLATMRASVDGLVSGDLSGRRPPRAGRVGRVVDRPARAPHRQPARPVPAADRPAEAAAAGPVARRDPAAGGRGPPAGRGGARGRRVGADGHDRRRAAGAGRRQPGGQRGAGLGRPAGAGAGARPVVDGRDHGGRPRTRRTPCGAGADVRAVPAARRHLAGRTRPRPGGGARPHRGDWWHAVRGGHPRRRADHGARSAEITAVSQR